MDKPLLRSIIEAEFAVPEGQTAVGLLPDLMEALASTDPELRDKLALEVLYTWISDGRFSAEVLRPLAGQLMGNLRAGVGQGENDQVFLRTFSALILESIVSYDIKARFLTREDVGRILDAALQYLAEEQDLRAFVPVKGWAHSAAHTADLLGGLSEHPELGEPELQRVLEAVSAKVLAQTPYPFLGREGFRLSNAVLTVLRRELVSLTWLAAWLEGLGPTEQRRSKAYVPGEDDVRYHNTEAFLQALYLMVTYRELPVAAKAELLPAIHAALKSFLPWWL